MAGSGSRYLAMGSNPFRTGISGQMDQFMLNAIGWLTGKAAGAPFKVALVQLDEGYWFPDESKTRAWLTAKYGAAVTTNAANAYDGANLGRILTDGADLVIELGAGNRMILAGVQLSNLPNGWIYYGG